MTRSRVVLFWEEAGALARKAARRNAQQFGFGAYSALCVGTAAMSLVRDARRELAPADAHFRRRSAIPLSYQSLSPLVATLDFVWIIAASVASGIAYHFVALGGPGDLVHYVGCGMAVAALFSMSARAYDLYRPANLLHPRSKIRKALTIWVMVFFCLATVAFTVKISHVFSRGAVLLFFVSGVVGIVVSRFGVALALESIISSGRLGGRRVALLTNTGSPQRHEELVEAFEHYGYAVVRVFDVAESDSNTVYSAQTADRVREVLRYARHRPLDEIILAIPWSKTFLIDGIAEELRALPIPLKLLPDSFVGRLLEHPLIDLGPSRAIELQRAPLALSQRAVKRLMDVVLSGLGLVVLAPVFAIMAIVIRLDSPGPAFFIQRRVGFNGRPFRIYKFRTMTTLDDGPVIRQASMDDARVTRIGRFLRRSSLDELPQLLNVLRGEMSLIGPRPHAVAHDNAYDKLIASYAIRQKMKPGLTGWAQVNGFRGETNEVHLMKRRVDHDLHYIDRWTLWLDLRILVMTVVQLVKMRGGY
jgi:Undecaprenyl-phosphate glucose phosphotransferase